MVSLPDCEHQATVDGEAGPPDVSSSDLEPIVALLRAKIGLEPGSVGAAWLASRVRARMEVTKVDSVARYSELASTSPDELAELAEEVVIPETWFFRDETPFQLFARYVVSEWLPLHGGRPLRVLSVPCASGEEPYSIAIVLLDAGLRPDQLRIDAVDLRREALDQAQRAVYPPNSFRGELLGLRARHFERVAEGFGVRPELRALVRFSRGNILDSDLAARRVPYDAVFCRNLMIYLDPAARERARRTVAALLLPDGLLVSGRAETVTVWGEEFRAIPQVETCAYRLARSAPPVRSASRGRTVGARKGRVSGQAADRPAIGSPPAAADERIPGGDGHPPPSLALARSLADRGDLEGAEVACSRLLDERGPSAAAFVLLAAIAGSKGEPDRVEALLGRALYLEPAHVEALALLALERQRRGDREGERLVRERLRRIAQAAAETKP